MYAPFVTVKGRDRSGTMPIGLLALADRGNRTVNIASQESELAGKSQPPKRDRKAHRSRLKLNCLNSSVQGENCSPAGNAIETRTMWLRRSATGRRKTLHMATENGSGKDTNGEPKSDCYIKREWTSRLPKCREAYGNGASIVVGGVTTTYSERRKPLTGQREAG